MPVDVDELQRSLNRFTNKYLRKVAPLKVDGEKGFATNRRVMTVKWYLGYGKHRNGAVTSPFVRRMRHPSDPKYFPEGMISTGRKRRRAQRKASEEAEQPKRGVTTFDGRPVAAWLKPYLDWARKSGWDGTLNSGWRDPVYSEQLCYRICGAPSCPGRCAGRASNHAGSVKPQGAVDVSDYGEFAALMRRAPFTPKIFNALGARDPVHFSPSGR